MAGCKVSTRGWDVVIRSDNPVLYLSPMYVIVKRPRISSYYTHPIQLCIVRDISISSGSLLYSLGAHKSEVGEYSIINLFNVVIS